MAKPKVNQELCIGCGACQANCPNVFRINDEGKSEVMAEDCGDCNCQKVIDECPVGAISME